MILLFEWLTFKNRHGNIWFQRPGEHRFSTQTCSGSEPRGCESDRLTFPVVVPVDVEGVQEVVVIMSQQVQTSGSRLDDADDLTVKQQLHTGLNRVLTQSHFTNNKHCFKGQMPTKHCYKLKQKVLPF